MEFFSKKQTSFAI